MSLSEKLIIAAKNGSTREVRKLLGRGALFTKDQFGNTALHEAAWNGNSDIVKVLLNSYCFVDSINYSGFTPLHLAGQNGHAKVAKTLLKWKADPSLLNQHGETAIHLVAKYNHTNVVAAFASFKVNVNIGGKDGNTPLHIAAKLGNIETLKALLSAGANPTIINDRGMRPVDYAESSGTKETVKVLHSAALKLKSKQQRSSSSLSAHRPPIGKMTSLNDGRPLTAVDTESTQQFRPRLLRASSTTSKLQISSSEDVPLKIKHKKNSYTVDPRLKMSESVPAHSFYGFSASQDTPLFVGPSDGYVYQPPQNPSSKSASIDQLLNEIEREYSGSEYRLQSAQENSDARNSRGISPYAEFHQLVGDCVSKSQPETVSVKQMRPPLPAKAYHRSTSEGRVNRTNYDFLPSGSGSPVESYDYLRPPNNRGPNSSNSPQMGSRDGTPPQTTTVLSGSPRDRRSASMDPLMCPSRSGLKHRRIYEQLTPKDGDDTDTYVYMAPLKDFPECAKQEQDQNAVQSPVASTASHSGANGVDGSGNTALDSSSELSVQADSCSTTSETSNGPPTTSTKTSGKPKKAVICDSALEVEPKHEPNTALEPPKGILSQPAETELEKSVLEQYLQEELETMRTAFQIRLSQIEKRYQRQLILEQQRNRQSPLLVRNPLVPQQRHTNTRRNSWHSCIPGNQDHDGLVNPEIRSGSSQGFDSDFSIEGSDVESDVVTVDRVTRKKLKKAVQFSLGGPDVYEHNTSPESADHTKSLSYHANSNLAHSTPIPANNKTKEGLKGGNGAWEKGSQEQASPRMSPLADLDDEKALLSNEAREVIQQKIHQYREKMGKYFQEKSEAQIAVIEKQYLVHMDEFKRQCSEREVEKVNHLESRIKDLENMLEVRTLV